MTSRGSAPQPRRNRRRHSPSTAPTSELRVLSIKKTSSLDLLRRLGDGAASLLPSGPESPAALTAGALNTDDQATTPSVEDRLNASLGCKTSEVALAILAQVVGLEHPNASTVSDDRIDTLLMNATAMLAELQPTTATQALLAAQMVGVQRAAMTFLANATKPEDTAEGRDRNVLRATRLMRLFTEQVEAMAKLKGKSSQQRVVVEHVTVSAGGQAIVGTVIPGGRGTSGDDGQ